MRILLICLAFTVVSCGAVQRFTTNITGGLTYKCSKHGVEYVQSDSGIALSRDENGSVIVCK